MTTLDQALTLAARGFHIFPCEPNGKLPVIKDYPNRATRDEDQIRRWFDGTNRNIGVSTTRFGDDKALVVVDVDTKKGKRGDETILGLELDGFDLPSTFEQSTPSGGRHIVYVADEPLKQGTDVLGSGADIRSRGGYILGPGSQIDGKPYAQINGHGTLAPAPGWLVLRLGADRSRSGGPVARLDGVDGDRAADRALAWLTEHAPVAVEGEAGDTVTFKVAAHLKDLGCSEDQAVFLMDMVWNERCSPPWGPDELALKVANAYRYGRDPQGIAAPEAVFDAVEPPEEESLNPFEKLNKDFAFVQRGGFVLQETTDERGRYTTEHLDIVAFNNWFANQPIQVGDRASTVSKEWMKWSGRRQYEGVVFMPQQQPDPRFYNLWRGFSVQPAATPNHPSVAAFLEHALKNVCLGDKQLFHWLMGYFAHLIQRPWQKPLVALVFKGAKGVGKNALVERVGALLGAHFLVADDDRYLLGNFNSHLEANLCFVLDEAAWAGDKRAEGKLKGLITGSQHNIERKGHEPYKINNLTRVVILGNEDWLVPASQDERRFAVFHVGEGRKQDRKFFHDMRVGMEQGGYANLLRYFLDFDLGSVDVDDAPNTAALIEQKHQSLPDVEKWWLDCLSTGQVVGGDWGGEWPDTVPTNRMREAYARWCRSRNIRSRLLEEVGFGRAMSKIAPSFAKKRARADMPGDRSYAYVSPGLESLRADWERYIGGKVEWPLL